MKIKGVLLIFLFFGYFLFAKEIKVRILSPMKPIEIKVKVVGKGYITGKNIRKMVLNGGEKFNFRYLKGKISFNFKGKTLSTTFLKINEDGGFLISSGEVKDRFYRGGFILFVKRGFLCPLIKKDVESFIPSIVMSETAGRGEEFIKAFSIVVRSYIYANLKRHIKEGYNFCSSTHCFYYRGDFRKGARHVFKWIKETGGLVLNKDGKVYSSNYSTCCGGVRFKVSGRKLLFQKFLEEPFCKNSKHFTYKRILNREKFLSDLKKIFKRDVLNLKYVMLQKIPYVKIIFKGGFTLLPVNVFRKKCFKLFKGKVFLSNYFTFKNSGNLIVVEGRGWGGNTGFCIEGARQMAKMGFDFRAILKFYFPECKLGRLF